MARWPRPDRFILKVPLQVHRQRVGRLVAARAVFLQTLQHDPVQVAAHKVNQLRWLRLTKAGGAGLFGREQRAETRGGAERFLLPDRATHFLKAGSEEFLRVERRAAREQFVEQHPQRIDVAARVDVRDGHHRLLGAHVGRRTQKLFERDEKRLVGKPSLCRLGDPEINDHGHPRRARSMNGHQNVRRLQVPVDDA